MSADKYRDRRRAGRLESSLREDTFSNLVALGMDASLSCVPAGSPAGASQAQCCFVLLQEADVEVLRRWRWLLCKQICEQQLHRSP